MFFLLLESVPGKRFAIFVLDKNIESKVFFNRDARKFLAKRVNAVLGNEGAEFSFRIDVFRGGRH
ncbi:MAG: hypothetical protein LBI95_04300 [Holosporales bacterium]|nr:hypothetical protein [Holosporales bacterium]